jgi:hypothetical protein
VFWNLSCFQIQVMTLLSEAFSVSLSLLKIGMLGCVAVSVAPPYQTALGGIGSGFLSSSFPLWMGHLVQAGPLK